MKLARPVLTVCMVLVLALGSASVMSRPALAQSANAGTTLQDNTITADPHWTRTFDWTIQKDVDQSLFSLFRGDSGVATYTVTLTKDAGTDAAWITGTICTTNGGERATTSLQIIATLRYGTSQGAPVINTALVDVSSNSELEPGERGCWDYSVEIPAAYMIGGANFRVDGDITITNHSGHTGTPFGPSPAITTSLPTTPTLINDSVNVDDTNGETWAFDTGGSVSYTRTFTCDADGGSHNNVATIRQTGQWDDADVQVNCYALGVSKTAFTSFNRTYEWSINKTGSQTLLTLAAGETYQVYYDVTVSNTGYTDSDWAVEGEITITNPAPMDATLSAVTESIDGAVVNCPALVVPAGGSLVCTYSADLPNATGFTNTATATLINTPSGTTDFTGSTGVSFEAATITEISTCAEVTDSLGGYLGTVCVGNAPQTFTYAYWVGPYEVCGQYRVDNTATYTTTTDTGDSSWTVIVNVPCGGCTLTPGYWKTHSINGPAPYDDTWGGREGLMFYLSGKPWYNVLWTPPAGNPYYQLSFQYIAAYLNKLNGAASTPQVDAAMAWAVNFFNTYTPSSTFSKSMKTQIITNAGILSSYNAGYTGPGHCDE